MAAIRELTSLDDPALDVYAHLTEAQLRSRAEPAQGIFIAESPKVIALALDAGCEPLSLLAERKHLTGDAAPLLARCGDIPVYTGSRALLAQLTGYTLTRGVLCAMRRPIPRSAEAVSAGARRVAVLENMVDATNLGAVFRSAAALGIDAVLLTPACCDPLCRRAVRVSMGTVFSVPWAYLPGDQAAWLASGVDSLRALGFTTAAMALRSDALPIDSPVLRESARLAILLGTEGDGLAASTVQSCDYVARIPMSHGVDSLNVAAAAAIAFWELRVRENGAAAK